MTAQEAITEIEKLKEAQLEYMYKMGAKNANTHALDKALEVLYKEAEIEESTEWVKEALESGYFDEKPINAVNPEEFDTETDKAISQSDVIDAIGREEALLCLTGEFETGEEVEKYVSLFSKRIKALPPVQPARRKGQWIKKNCDLLYCSVCDLPSMHPWPYCEMCGAEMAD